MVSVELLPVTEGMPPPDGRELGSEISAIDQVLVEGVPRSASLACPAERLVGLRKSEQREA
jgi:hypothetical protein